MARSTRVRTCAVVLQLLLVLQALAKFHSAKGLAIIPVGRISKA
jgi:hypothetical protein